MKHLLLLVVLCAAFGAEAQVYKWVDKDGKVQYSDQPPPPGAAKSEAQKVTSMGISSSSASTSTPAKSLMDRAKDSDKTKAEADEKLKKDDAAAKMAQRKQEACTLAKSAAKTLMDGGRITTTGPDGERTLMDDAEIEKEQAKTEKLVAEACSK